MFFSTAYALSGFVAAYSWDVMWMDVVAVAPLAIVGLEKLVRDKKPVLYYVSLALCILSNYYLSIMLCIFLVFWFAWAFLYAKMGGKNGCNCEICRLLAFGWRHCDGANHPGAYHFKLQRFVGHRVSKADRVVFNLLSEVGRMCTTASVYEGAENWPNLYAGAFSVIAFDYCLCSIKGLIGRKKIAPILFVLVFHGKLCQ